MALINIEYGSVASSKILNDNFNYLEALVAEASTKLDGFNDGVDSKIATSKKVLTEAISEVNSKHLPIGSIIAWSSASIPSGWIAMIGQSISAYKDLVAVIGKETLPDTRDRVLWGNSTPLNTIEAGLPNIEAHWYAVAGKGGNDSSGAVTVESCGEGPSQSGWTHSAKYTFDASKSNDIYKKSETVQPPAVTVVWIIKYE